jgi:hypothetical protein
VCWEGGEVALSERRLREIAKVLGVKPAFLLS